MYASFQCVWERWNTIIATSAAADNDDDDNENNQQQDTPHHAPQSTTSIGVCGFCDWSIGTTLFWRMWWYIWRLIVLISLVILTQSNMIGMLQLSVPYHLLGGGCSTVANKYSWYPWRPPQNARYDIRPRFAYRSFRVNENIVFFIQNLAGLLLKLQWYTMIDRQFASSIRYIVTKRPYLHTYWFLFTYKKIYVIIVLEK